MSWVRQLLLLLIAVSLVCAGTAPLARAAQCASMSAMPVVPSDRAMTSMAMAKDAGMLPGKAVRPDCVKHVCCVTTPCQPADTVEVTAAARFVAVTYWLAAYSAAGLTHQPEFVPLRTS